MAAVTYWIALFALDYGTRAQLLREVAKVLFSLSSAGTFL